MGMTTAYALWERGDDVIVLESREGVALETSYANGGMFTPSMPEPWNSPGVYKHLAASLFNPRSSMKLRLRAIPSLFGWGVEFLKHSSLEHYRAACEANYALASYSLGKTQTVSKRLALEYCRGARGTLSVFRNANDFMEKHNVCQRLARLGMRYAVLNVDEMIRLVPALEDIRHKIHNGIFYSGDEHGDSHQFCQGLAAAFLRAGGEIRCDTKVLSLIERNRRVRGVATYGGQIEADRIVVAAGTSSADLLRSVGLPLRVKPVKGYSVTVDVSGIDGVPDLPVLDDSMHAGMTPLGHRLRMVGTAEFAGFDTSINTVRTDNLYSMFKQMLPSIAAQVDSSTATPWAGLRPMSSDGKPYIGATPLSGLFVNCGQGHLGWTMAVGSAHLLADIVTGKPTEIDAAAFAYMR